MLHDAVDRVEGDAEGILEAPPGRVPRLEQAAAELEDCPQRERREEPVEPEACLDARQDTVMDAAQADRDRDDECGRLVPRDERREQAERERDDDAPGAHRVEHAADAEVELLRSSRGEHQVDADCEDEQSHQTAVSHDDPPCRGWWSLIEC